LGQYFEKFNNYGQFWWFKLKFAIEFTFLARKTHQKGNFIGNIGVFSSNLARFYIKELYGDKLI
jgi:hypothetical protein